MKFEKKKRKVFIGYDNHPLIAIKKVPELGETDVE